MRPRQDGLVLHVQKVAGISGSEAHLLQLLPDLRERGWDVEFLMLHEDEPGAWEFARELEARGVPLDDVRLRADVDPIAYAEVASYLARRRPRILHTHLVHADVYGQIAGAMARVPLRLSTKHGFNWFREGRFFGLADRAVASLAHVHIAISQGLAATSPRSRASTRAASRSSTTGSPRATASRRTPGRSRACSASAG